MERDRRLARAGLAVEEVEVVGRKTAGEDLVESGNADEDPRRLVYGGVARRRARL